MINTDTKNLTRKPTFMRHLGFYANRMRKEKMTKVFAASVASLSLVLQLTAGIIPMSSNTALAAGDDNIVRNGVQSKSDMLAVYDRNSDGAGHNDIQAIYTHFGVSRQDIANSTMGSYKSNDFNGQIKSIGRSNFPNSGRTAVSVPGASTTIYTGPFLNGDNSKPVVQKALIGKRSVDGKWFAITLDCGNIAYVDMPEKPKPTPQPAAVCSSLSVSTISRNNVKMTARATVTNGAKISGYRYVVTKDGAEVLNRTVASTTTSSTLSYTAADAGNYTARVTVLTSVGEKTANACVKPFTIAPVTVVKIENIEVCDLKTKDIITIDKKDYDAAKHSKDLTKCDTEVCEIATSNLVTIKDSEYDAEVHSRDLADCDEVPVAPVTPVELPKTGLGEDIAKVLGLGSIIAAVGYYVASRRGLLAAMLNR